MKVNAILTGQDFGGKLKVNKSARLVFNPQWEAIGSISKKWLFDLNGEKIARYRGKDDDGVFKYVALKGDGEGNKALYLFDGEKLRSNEGGILGTAEYGTRVGGALIPLVFTALALVAIIILLSLTGQPTKTPVLVIREDDFGVWGAEQEINVFDGALCPGSNGAYKFEIENPTDADMEYKVAVTDGNDWGGNSPVMFRLKMNNVYVVGDGENWKKAEELALAGLQFPSASKQGFTLEWSWPYESGQDEYDTAIGQMGGVYNLTISITAEIVELPEILNV
ncbi:MAG: hypothetical protein DBX59_08620 [Bacillota bacterium]|nr:MAG: hypothetical protein DBX59_08620 [Bacillota bacterium]